MNRIHRIVAGFLAVGLFSTGMAVAAEPQKSQSADSAPAVSEGQGGAPLGIGRGTPEENQAMMQQMMGAMMGQMMDAMSRVMAKPEFANNMATFMRNYYLALKKAGFTEEEAMKIVVASGLPSMGSK